VTEETLRHIFPWAAGIGASEAAPIMRFLNRSGGTAVTRTLSQMAEEGGQEWFQSVGENIVARANYDDLRRWDDNAWSNLTIGAILGGGMQGGAELRGNVREARLGGSRTDVSPHQQPTPGQPPAGPPPLPGEEGRLPWMQPHIDDAIRQMLGDAAQPPPAQSHSLLQQMLSDTSPAVVRLSLDTLVVGRAVQ